MYISNLTLSLLHVWLLIGPVALATYGIVVVVNWTGISIYLLWILFLGVQQNEGS